MIKKYIKIAYISLLSALFLLGLSYGLNNLVVSSKVVTFIGTLFTTFRVVMHLVYEINELIKMLSRKVVIIYGFVNFTVHKTVFFDYVNSRKELLNRYRLNVIRC